MDVADNDPVRFWRYVVAALRTVHGEINEHLQTLLDAPEPPTGDAVVTALVNARTAYPPNAVLILDNYHLITSPASMIASRCSWSTCRQGGMWCLPADPPLPLARWRARNQLAELRAGNMQFTHA